MELLLLVFNEGFFIRRSGLKLTEFGLRHESPTEKAYFGFCVSAFGLLLKKFGHNWKARESLKPGGCYGNGHNTLTGSKAKRVGIADEISSFASLEASQVRAAGGLVTKEKYRIGPI